MTAVFTSYYICNMTGLVERGRIWLQTHIEEEHAVNMKIPIYRPPREAWNRTVPHSPWKEPTLLIPYLQTSKLQNRETIHFCGLSHPHWFVVLCYSSPGKLIQCVLLNITGLYSGKLSYWVSVWSFSGTFSIFARGDLKEHLHKG